MPFWKNRRLLIITILVLILLPILLVYSIKLINQYNYNKKASEGSQYRQKVISDTISKAAYYTKKNPDQSTDYYIRGTIQKITDQPHSTYSITMKLTPASASGELVQFTLPKYPPQSNSAIYGSFKEMFDKGFKTIDFRVRYDQYYRFWGWEVLNSQR